MVGWPHRLNGHESEQAPGDSEGQGGLACCSPWGRKASDSTERLNSKNSYSELTVAGTELSPVSRSYILTASLLLSLIL